ncbi:MAG: thioesterase family protein [Myxococcales bacterium]|nr:acyl-CoA thioesterase [Polyangiaceae bacterium]MDW8248838.1 thioesterase family protein [Myxococcales bacterium]
MEPLYTGPCTVRFQDIDAAGIAFYGRVFDYFHDAYVAHLAARGLPLHQVIARRSWIMPLVHAEADYRRPLRFGEAYRIELRADPPGRSSYTLRYRIVDLDGQLHAEGATVHVCIDLTTDRPRELPEELRAALSMQEERSG